MTADRIADSRWRRGGWPASLVVTAAAAAGATWLVATQSASRATVPADAAGGTARCDALREELEALRSLRVVRPRQPQSAMPAPVSPVAPTAAQPAGDHATDPGLPSTEVDAEFSTLEWLYAADVDDDPAWARATERDLASLAWAAGGELGSLSVHCRHHFCRTEIDAPQPATPDARRSLARFVARAVEILPESHGQEHPDTGRTTLVFVRPGTAGARHDAEGGGTPDDRSED